jgi:hypothetical protein
MSRGHSEQPVPRSVSASGDRAAKLGSQRRVWEVKTTQSKEDGAWGGEEQDGQSAEEETRRERKITRSDVNQLLG